MIGEDLAEVARVTTIPAAGLPQPRKARLGVDTQVQHHWVAVWPLIPTGATGDVNNRRLGLFLTVVAAIDMKTGASEMGKARRQAEALGRGRGNAAVEFCHASRLEGISG